jgi:hypothetical protein
MFLTRKHHLTSPIPVQQLVVVIITNYYYDLIYLSDLNINLNISILIHCKDDKNSNSNELILLRSVVLTKNINDFGEICYLPITYAFIWKWFQTKKIL